MSRHPEWRNLRKGRGSRSSRTVPVPAPGIRSEVARASEAVAESQTSETKQIRGAELADAVRHDAFMRTMNYTGRPVYPIETCPTCGSPHLDACDCPDTEGEVDQNEAEHRTPRRDA